MQKLNAAIGSIAIFENRGIAAGYTGHRHITGPIGGERGGG